MCMTDRAEQSQQLFGKHLFEICHVNLGSRINQTVIPTTQTSGKSELRRLISFWQIVGVGRLVVCVDGTYKSDYMYSQEMVSDEFHQQTFQSLLMIFDPRVGDVGY